jgi:hypothetical protein
MVGPAIAGTILPRGASERRMILNADITEDKCLLLFEPGTRQLVTNEEGDSVS